MLVYRKVIWALKVSQKTEVKNPDATQWLSFFGWMMSDFFGGSLDINSWRHFATLLQEQGASHASRKVLISSPAPVGTHGNQWEIWWTCMIGGDLMLWAIFSMKQNETNAWLKFDNIDLCVDRRCDCAKTSCNNSHWSHWSRGLNSPCCAIPRWGPREVHAHCKCRFCGLEQRNIIKLNKWKSKHSQMIPNSILMVSILFKHIMQSLRFETHLMPGYVRRCLVQPWIYLITTLWVWLT